MTKAQYTAWVIFWVMVVGLVVFIICGCAGGGVAYYASEPEVGLGNYDAASLPPPDEPFPPPYVPQEVWIRHMGQPDQLVQVMPAY